MTIGIAIPTYDNHLKYLKTLLDSISKSTILPQQVSVSISSFDNELILPTYPFELIISKTLDYKNPSQNRNIAASKLTTDIVSFIDGDDLPHVKRNEFILESFKKGGKIVVHNYSYLNQMTSVDENIGELIFLIDDIDKYINELHFPMSSKEHGTYHNAHVSILKSIFNDFKYNEDENYKYKEDSEYTSRLVKNNYKISYIKNKLSYYNK